MKSPVTGRKMILKYEQETFDFRKEPFEILYHFYECEESGERYETEELTQLNLNQVYNQYRKKYKFPFPEEIKKLKETYGLSSAKMSEVLGFGINVYRNYEQGEIPSSSNARLIQLAQDPTEFRKLADLCDTLSPKVRLKINQKIDSLILEKAQHTQFNLEDFLMGRATPDETTGYRKPNLKKIIEMVVFFTIETTPWKTKMNKLLFYADFLHFKKKGISISGAQYRAINMGPVPRNYQSLFEYVVNNDHVDVDEKVFDDGISERFRPNKGRPFEPELFSEDELETLALVAQKFKRAKTQEIIDISHMERAWKDHFSKGKRVIDYAYAFELINI